jgi:thioredoxin-related protein
MITRRKALCGSLAAAGAMAVAPYLASGRSAAGERIEPQVNDDGLYTQPWFLHSFLELGDDLAEAHAAGKRLAVIWEQKGCPYCKEMHLVNFADPQINDYVRENFEVLQLNIHGLRETTDFDGELLDERALARRWGIRFTPTIHFFPEDPADADGKVGVEAEVARMPGYFKPPHFLAMFRFVRETAYEEEDFRSFLKRQQAS